MANDVIINVKSNTKGAQQGLSNMQTSLKKLGDGARKAGMAFAAIGAGGVVAIKGFVSAALEQQRSTQLLANSIENLGVSYDSVRHDIEKTTSALQAKTNFGDEEQMRALALMVPMLGSVDKAMAALPAVMDAASVKGVSLSTVAGTLTRALSGQVNTAITLGMAFDESADFGERLAQVLEAIAGAAEANADPLTQLNNDIGDLKEKIGFALLPVVDPVVQSMREWAVEMQEVDETTLQTIAKVAAIGTAIAVAGGAFLLFVGFIPAIVAGFTAIGAALVAIGFVPIAIGAAIVALAAIWFTNWGNIQDKTEFVMDKLGIEFNDLLHFIGPAGLIVLALKNLEKEWEFTWHGLGGRGQRWGSWLKDQFGLTESSKEFLEPIIDDAKKLGSEFMNAGKEVATFEHNMGIHMSAVANDIGKVEHAAHRLNNALANMFQGEREMPAWLFGGPGMSFDYSTGHFVPRAQHTPDIGRVFEGAGSDPSAVGRNIAAMEAQKQATIQHRMDEWVTRPDDLIAIEIDGRKMNELNDVMLGRQTTEVWAFQ